MKERGFPGARWTHDRNKFAFFDVDVDVTQDIKELSSGQRIKTFDASQLDHDCFTWVEGARRMVLSRRLLSQKTFSRCVSTRSVRDFPCPRSGKGTLQ